MYKPKQPKFFQSDVNNRFLSRPNEGIQFGSNGQEYSGGATGLGSFDNPSDESSYWANDKTYQGMLAEAKRLEGLNNYMANNERNQLLGRMMDYKNNKFSYAQKLPMGANAPTSPTTSTTPASVPAAAASTPSLNLKDPYASGLVTTASSAPGAVTMNSASAPAGAPSAPAAAAAASGGAQTPPDGGSDPCAGIMDQIKEADAMRNKLEATARPDRVGGQHQGQTQAYEMQLSVLHKIQQDNYKQLMACKDLREKTRNAPRIKAQKEAMALKIKSDNDKQILKAQEAEKQKAFQANARQYGATQSDDITKKLGALLSSGAISPDQFGQMSADPDTFKGTVGKMFSDQFGLDAQGFDSQGYTPGEAGNSYSPGQSG